MGPTSPRVVTKLTTRKTANSFLWLVLTGARTTSERFSGHPLAQTLPSHHRWRYPHLFSSNPTVHIYSQSQNHNLNPITYFTGSLPNKVLFMSHAWHVLINYFRKRNIIFTILFKMLSQIFLNIRLIVMNEKKVIYIVNSN